MTQNSKLISQILFSDFCENLFRQNPVYNAHLAGTAIWIYIFADVLFGQLIDVCIGAVFSDLNHLSFQRQVPIGVFRVLNAECNYRVASHIAVFHAAFGAVDDDMGSIEFTPYGRDLWGPVAHECRQLSERFLLKKIGEIVGNSAHMFQLLLVPSSLNAKLNRNSRLRHCWPARLRLARSHTAPRTPRAVGLSCSA